MWGASTTKSRGGRSMWFGRRETSRSRIRSARRIQRRQRDVAPFHDVTAREWVERVMGPQAWEKVWGPLLNEKFGRHADDITMAWLWSKLTVRRQIKGSQARHELLGYPRQSWERL